MGRNSVIPDKGHMARMFEPWQSRPDSKNTAFNAATFTKWYNSLIDATQRLRIPQDLINCNTRNISFSMNQHHTFFWPRHVSREDFHTRMLSFYLDEEAFEKEFMSWLGVKQNQRKLGMHYILPMELLNKKDKKEEAEPSSGPEPHKPDAPAQSDSKEEE
jgi:hypothetical protein